MKLSYRAKRLLAATRGLSGFSRKTKLQGYLAMSIVLLFVSLFIRVVIARKPAAKRERRRSAPARTDTECGVEAKPEPRLIVDPESPTMAFWVLSSENERVGRVEMNESGFWWPVPGDGQLFVTCFDAARELPDSRQVAFDEAI